MLSDNTEMTVTWTELTKDLIDLGYQVWKVVAPVVASDSPEGHLPMDNVSSYVLIFIQKTIEKNIAAFGLNRQVKCSLYYLINLGLRRRP